MGGCYLVADFGVCGRGDLGDVYGVVGCHVDTGGGLASGVGLTTTRQGTRRERSHLAHNKEAKDRGERGEPKARGRVGVFEAGACQSRWSAK